MRALFYLILIVGLTGCATTRSVTNVDNLQIKVSQLEKQVEQNGQDVSDLRTDVQQLSDQMNEMDANQAGSSASSSPEMKSSAITKPDGDIIRVAASASEVQKALKGAGYYTGTVDGKIGGMTKKAIEDFQRDHGLTADGIIGQRTWSELKKYSE